MIEWEAVCCQVLRKMPKFLLHPERDSIQLEAVLRALGDPIRMSIVRQLAKGEAERTCGFCSVPVSKSTKSHHFRVLREAGVIRVRIEGTFGMVSLRREDLSARFPRLLDTILVNH